MTATYEVHAIPRDMTKEWILKIHYAKRLPQICHSFGLFMDGILVGVATYGLPASPTICTSICGEKYKHIVIELNRLVLLNNLKNEASILVGRSLRMIPKPKIIVSYADAGIGHIGYVYQATNWIYTGLSMKSGCFSRIEVHGKERTGKSFYHELGTQAIDTIKEHYPDAIFHKRTQKHRYIFFIGNKKQVKKMRNSLRYDTQPYPKGDKAHCDTNHDIQATQMVML